MPLIILLSAYCEANPNTNDATPAPASDECPTIFNSGT